MPAIKRTIVTVHLDGLDLSMANDLLAKVREDCNIELDGLESLFLFLLRSEYVFKNIYKEIEKQRKARMSDIKAETDKE